MKSFWIIISFVVFLFTGYSAPSESMEKLTFDSVDQTSIDEAEAYYKVVPAKPANSAGFAKEQHDHSSAYVPGPLPVGEGKTTTYESRLAPDSFIKRSGFIYARKYQSSYLG